VGPAGMSPPSLPPAALANASHQLGASLGLGTVVAVFGSASADAANAMTSSATALEVRAVVANYGVTRDVPTSQILRDRWRSRRSPRP
jgi:hypothetical protein